MKTGHILFGLSFALTSLVTASASAYDKGSEQHVYSSETEVIPIENGSEQHVYSSETEVIPYEKQSEIVVDRLTLP